MSVARHYNIKEHMNTHTWALLMQALINREYDDICALSLARNYEGKFLKAFECSSYKVVASKKYMLSHESDLATHARPAISGRNNWKNLLSTDLLLMVLGLI